MNILATADWHLGNPRVSTADTISDIRSYLLPRITPEIDVMFIAGDIYDGEVSFNSDPAEEIIALFMDILLLCYDNNVALRIVRGTYSHDMLQLSIWNKLCHKVRVPVDFKLFNELAIERFKDIDTSILYIPDNHPFKNKAELFDNIHSMLTANNLKKVDYVVMHGTFDHMLFGFMDHEAFSVKDFKPILKKLIIAGHIHKPHQYHELIYTGSINRLAHNEEEAKGFWMIKDAKAQFIPNPSATLFITLDYSNFDQFDSLLAKHIEIVKRFDPERQGFLRILLSDTNMKQALIKYHVANHPNIRLTFEQASRNTTTGNDYLKNKLKSECQKVLEVPSLRNVASIVCRHLSLQGMDIDINVAEDIINGTM